MEETKKVLRSILVSTPRQINVLTLDNDYKQLVGSHIPYKELGYDSLLSLLRSIPDVLRVCGNTMYADVSLIVSEKTAHVNDMVLRQKTGKRNYQRYVSSPRSRMLPPPPQRMLQPQPRMFSPQHRTFPPQHGMFPPHPRMLPPQPRMLPPQPRMLPPQAEKLPPPPKTFLDNNPVKPPSTSNSDSSKPIKIKVKNSSRLTIINQEKSNPIYEQNMKNLKFSRLQNTEVDPYNVDLKLKVSTEISPKSDVNQRNNNIHYLRRVNYKNETLKETSSTSLMDTSQIHNLEAEVNLKYLTLNEEELINKDTDDFMRQLLLKKQTMMDVPKKLSSHRSQLKTSGPSPDYKKRSTLIKSRIPAKMCDNFRQLITDFPEGIWCSELPDQYKKRFRKELDFDGYGYMCLVHMCMDLEDIFHCSKESSCDFKLYDARKPLPKVRIQEDLDVKYISNNSTSPGVAAAAIPQLNWSAYTLTIPEEVIPPGAEIPREFVKDRTKIGDILKVVVADIYDLSKFWIYKNNGLLDRLMDDMQSFYIHHNQEYLIPEHLLKQGLYCAVITLDEFHRAIILNLQCNEDLIKVFFIDYGTVGKIKKNQVWFLLKKFCKLSAQAIRSRLADIYPPVENTTWSERATARFQELASMKHLEAVIQRVIHEKDIIELYLEIPKSPGTYMNHLLSNEGHALTAPRKRQPNLPDPNCIPKVKYIHLFPTFEEIEYGLVPSIAEMTQFRNTEVTAHFFFPHYFTRPDYKEEIEKIERKNKKALKRKEELDDTIDLSVLSKNFKLVHEMTKDAFGNLYHLLRDDIDKSVQGFIRNIEQYTTKVEDEKLEISADSFQGHLKRSRPKDFNKNLENLAKDEEDSVANFTKSTDSYSEEVFQTPDLDIRKKPLEIGESELGIRKEAFGMRKYVNSIGNLANLSLLERYLSEEDISSREASPPISKLIDFDDLYQQNIPDYLPPDSNLHLPSATFSNYTSTQHCLQQSADYVRAGESISLLDKPLEELTHPHETEETTNSSSSDLIQLDVVLDNTPLLIPEVIGPWNPSKSAQQFLTKGSATANFTLNIDATDDSNNILDPNANSFLPEPSRPPTTEQLEQLSQTVETTLCDLRGPGSSNDPNVPETSSSVVKSSDVPCSPVSSNCSEEQRNLNISSNMSETSVVPSGRVETENVSSTSTVVSSINPPPGFGPVPMYGHVHGVAPPPGMGYTLYYPWSTADYATSNPQACPLRSRNGFNVPPFYPQHLISQVASAAPYPPIIVLNFNGMPYTVSNLESRQ